MGMFSWITQDTHKSITGPACSAPGFPVTMTAPDGRKWYETSYGGYGEFGGKDFYDLVAEINDWESRVDAYLEQRKLEHEQAKVRCEENYHRRMDEWKAILDDPVKNAVFWKMNVAKDAFSLNPNVAPVVVPPEDQTKDWTEEELKLAKEIADVNWRARNAHRSAPFGGTPDRAEIKRHIGIKLALGSEPYLSPNLTEDPDWEWVNQAPLTCPGQGFIFEEDDPILTYRGSHSRHPIYCSGVEDNSEEWIVSMVVMTEDEDELDPDDPTMDEQFTYWAWSEEEALDKFHDEVPISCLENYSITAEKAEKEEAVSA